MNAIIENLYCGIFEKSAFNNQTQTVQFPQISELDGTLLKSIHFPGPGSLINFATVSKNNTAQYLADGGLGTSVFITLVNIKGDKILDSVPINLFGVPDAYTELIGIDYLVFDRLHQISYPDSFIKLLGPNETEFAVTFVLNYVRNN